jgi:hypothetical protein
MIGPGGLLLVVVVVPVLVSWGEFAKSTQLGFVKNVFLFRVLGFALQIH